MRQFVHFSSLLAVVFVPMLPQSELNFTKYFTKFRCTTIMSEMIADLVELLSLSTQAPIRGTAMEYVLGLTAAKDSLGLFDHRPLIKAGTSSCVCKRC